MGIAAIVIMGFAMILQAVMSGVGISETNRQNEENREHEKELNQQQQEFAAKEAEKANQREIENYLNFQSPQAMMRQIKSAGLSPSYAYGNNGVSSGSLKSGAQAQSPSLHGAFTDAVGMGNQYAQIGQSANTAANTALQFNEAIKSGKQSKLVEAQTLTEKYNAMTQEAISRIQGATADNIHQALDIEFNKSIAETKLLQEQWRKIGVETDEWLQLQDTRISTTRQMMNAAADEALQKLQLNEEQMKLCQARVREIDKSLALKEKELNEKIRQFNEEIATRKDLSHRERELKRKMFNAEIRKDKEQFKQKMDTQQKQWQSEFDREGNMMVAKSVGNVLDRTATHAVNAIDAIVPF